MTATCATCHEPRVPLIRCATCEAMSCELCSFGDDFVCFRCHRRREPVNPGGGLTMTLLDAIRELSELYPGRYVNIAVSVGIHKHNGNLPTLGVTCYVDGFGNVAYHAPTIEVAMELSRAKARSTAPLDAAELAISDASLPVEVCHVG